MVSFKMREDVIFIWFKKKSLVKLQLLTEKFTDDTMSAPHKWRSSYSEEEYDHVTHGPVEHNQ